MSSKQYYRYVHDNNKLINNQIISDGPMDGWFLCHKDKGGIMNKVEMFCLVRKGPPTTTPNNQL
jgi:hypothetical protein